jgi:ABC-type phosphonate transport system ATPase subunit
MPQAYSQRKAQRMRAAQHISIPKRAVQDEPEGFLDVDSQPPLTKLLKAIPRKQQELLTARFRSFT